MQISNLTVSTEQPLHRDCAERGNMVINKHGKLKVKGHKEELYGSSCGGERVVGANVRREVLYCMLSNSPIYVVHIRIRTIHYS